MGELDKAEVENAKEAYIESLYEGHSIVKARERIGVKEGVIWEWEQKDKEFEHNVLKALESQFLTEEPTPTKEKGRGYIRPSERNFE